MEGNIDVRERQQSVASRTLPTRDVPWLGIELATFQSPGQHSIHWAIPARVACIGFTLYDLVGAGKPLHNRHQPRPYSPFLQGVRSETMPGSPKGI